MIIVGCLDHRVDPGDHPRALSINVFDPPLHGLVMADAEFCADQAAQPFRQPPETVA